MAAAGGWKQGVDVIRAIGASGAADAVGVLGTRPTSGRVAVIGALLAVLVSMTGCVEGSTEPIASPTSSATPSPTPTPTPTPTPRADPVLVPGGTAGQNRPFFEFVILQSLALNTQPTSLEIVDTLVAAGFPRESLEVTADTTRVGDPADSILFSVLIDGQCLLGQIAKGSFEAELADVLGSGRCLVGRTVSLD